MPPLISDTDDEDSLEFENLEISYDTISDLPSQDDTDAHNTQGNYQDEDDTHSGSHQFNLLDSVAAQRPWNTDDAFETAQPESLPQYFRRDAFEAAQFEAKLDEKRKLSHIQKSDWAYPKSRYEGYSHHLPVSKERRVVKDFISNKSRNKRDLKNDRSLGCEQFTEFELTDFSIYLPGDVAHHKWEMRGLQNLATRAANSWYCFDGILRFGNLRRYVQGVPFKICSIGRYGEEFDSIADDVWIQSISNHETDIYYKLKTPSSEYSRFHQGFLWVANLAKYFVDYSQNMIEREEKISIHHFRSEFTTWLEDLHGHSPVYRQWYMQHDHRDFRRAVAANIEYLWKEYIGIKPNHFKHDLWSQVKDINFIPKQPLKEKMTIVTPYVYDCFSHLKFKGHLKKVTPVKENEILSRSKGHAFHLTVDASSQADADDLFDKCDLTISKSQNIATNKILERKFDRQSIAVGDVLGVTKDKITSWKDEGSKWKVADECWWVLVQGIHKDKKGKRSFDVIWLYKPSDTTCAKMRYPYHDELFLSDNCNCDRHRVEEAEVLESHVLCRATITWHGLPGDNKSDFFVRQTYLHDNSFVTMKENHKRCEHLRNDLKSSYSNALDEYRVGATVLTIPLAKWNSKHDLEPAEIVEFIPQGNLEIQGVISLKRLRRRRDVDTSMSRPNELVYTEEVFSVSADKVIRKCLVRFYTEEELIGRNIPAPYCRDGTGNAFYIICRLVHGVEGDPEFLKPIKENLPQSLIQGFDPKVSVGRELLRGMDLFCGGGNFGRGLEEGGAVRMTHAVDLAGNAIHTHYANQNEPDTTKYFYGSVDDVLYQGLHDNPAQSDLIPLPGMIDFLSAGSPCQGYSLLNARRSNEQGLKNQSLVASVAAYVDFYRPKYALLENVISMAAKGRGRDEDVLAQLICCLVGMGYQVQLFLLDAWSFGSAQSRSRLFVSMAAAGLELPQHPGLSHSHPVGTVTRGLGQGANGLSFGERKFEPTAFEFVTANEATLDLEDIADGSTNHCTRHPDHRATALISHKMKVRIQAIPRYPRGMNFFKTWQSDLLTKAELSLFPLFTRGGKPKQSAQFCSRAWGRTHPHKLFNTIATALAPADARTGRALHWDQHRTLTVMEARRAQSFPDEEILTGIPTKQLRIVGNSVARTVSLALGIVLREVWLSSRIQHDNLDAYVLGLELNAPAHFISQAYKDTTSIRVEPNRYAAFRQSFEQPSAKVAGNEMELTEYFSDEATLSDRRYRNSLETLGVRSSVSRDEYLLSGNSTPWSERTDSKGRKRRPEQGGSILALSRSKKVKLGQPDEKDLNYPGSIPFRDIRRSSEGKMVNRVEDEHKEHKTNSRVEPQSLRKALRAFQAEQIPMEQQKGGVSKNSQQQSLPSPRHRDHSISSAKNSTNVISFLSDSEDSDAKDSEEDVVTLVRSQKIKAVQPFTLPDNSMCGTYEQTYSAMRLSRPQKRKKSFYDQDESHSVITID